MIINGGTINGGTVYDLTDLFPFTTFTFTSNIVGEQGPTLGNLYNTYSNTGNTWLTNTNYFTVPNNWRGYQVWTVPRTGAYRITAAGSRSGVATAFSSNIVLAANAHGRGSVVQGIFNLTRGQKITLVVGQPAANTTMGATYSSPGGGGGSFVVRGNIASDGFANVVPLLVAGGGGAVGTWTSNAVIRPGGYGVTTQRGGNSAGNASATITSLRFGAPGGVNGFGGNTHVSVIGTVSTNGYDSGGGGGYYGNGRQWNGVAWTYNTTGTGGFGGGGASFANGAVGGAYSSATYPPPATSSGGFGGGSGSGPIVGGAGGGWSGGGGGTSGANPGIDSGGGGGSYISSEATSVATSDGQFDLDSTFNGSAITNLGFYNNTAGYISIVKL